MENVEIASALEEVADLLELQEGNPFRIRAYRNAARTVRELTHPLRLMVEDEKELTELPGIGKEMAAHIQEMVEWGRLGLLEDLSKEVPRSLIQLTRLDGVGPKKARRLWQELGVTSVNELEEAVRKGKVAELGGFGTKSVQGMARAIESFRRLQGRFLLSEVDLLLAPLLPYVEGIAGVQRVTVAGSYRRRRETVGDVDLLVLCPEVSADQVMEEVMRFPGIARKESAGDTRGRMVLGSGLAVDIRLAPRESFGAALHYFTGSKEHNVALRSLAVGRGLKVNEYGVFRSVIGGPEGDGGDASTGQGASTSESGVERVGGEREEDVFVALGMPWISPLLREGRGELEAAREGRLPELISLGDIRGDLQMHSTWSDGENSLEEMLAACLGRGYEYASITDHSQAVTVAGGLRPDQVRAQWEEVERVRAAVPGIRLFRSLEVDILKDGSLDMPDEILAELDLVLVSVHSFMGMDQETMTRRVLRALEHPEVDILAHPTGRILNRREPFALDVESVLHAAAEYGVAVELNAHPGRLDLNDRYVWRAKELGVKVVINTDAHSIRDLENMRYGVDQAGRGWLEPADVLNSLAFEDFERWRRRRHTA